MTAGMVALATVLALSGCATLPQPRDLPPIASVENLASSASFSAPEVSWPSDRWWEGFGDPQLNTLIAEGLVGATDLRVAEARFARAEALVSETRSRLLPSLGANAEAGATKQSYNYLIPEAFSPKGWPDYGQATLRLDWELDFWGRNRAALAAARSDARAAGAEAAATRLAVSAGVASAYADLAALYAEHDAAEHALEVRRRTLDLMQGRKVEGLEHDGAVERARSALAAAQGDLAALDEALTLNRNRIAVLIGAGPDRGLVIARPAAMVSGSFGLPVSLPAELIGRRPDIIAARLRSEAAASRIKEARAAFYPNVNLAGLIGLQALGIDNVFKSGSEFGTAGPALSLPIFDGGRLRSRHRAAETDYQAAVAQYDGALVQALREVADAAASQRALGERLDRAAQAERAAAAAWTVANNRYRGGLATFLDVLVAEDALITSRRTLASLKTRAFVLDVALIRALGGGYRS
ncbi:efflux transporter outer membrane subunit [Sphingobium fluviale]|uniref:Efflux transporter outer membrane subunit n=2 Tax=Alphaproteobacteria TaxID=28211 RepID=A0A4V1N352_9SPHN|nr:efflux transporter outer membrane subunit [Sphingobium fluviale]